MGAGLVEGKVALVTGAGSGIGAAVAALFAEEGAAAVVVSDLDERLAAETARTVERLGATAVAVGVDTADREAVEAMVSSTVDRFGRLDCAHNCAGIAGPVATVADYPLDGWDRVLAVNLWGTVYAMQAELRAMLPASAGAIVNTSSAATLQAPPGLSAYVASKMAVTGLTQVAASEVAARGIRVNVVLPGAIRSRMSDSFIDPAVTVADEPAQRLPMKRRGTPEEAAELVVWLCSDRASYITGASYVVDGGQHSVLGGFPVPQRRGGAEPVWIGRR